MKYFKMEEFRCKDGSVTPEEAKVNLTALVDKVLDPARERYGAKIQVNSGYRTEAYNMKVGGTPGSQHCCKGGSAAADICAVHSDFGCMKDWKAANLAIAKAIVAGGQWDQMILYPTLTSSTSDATRKSSSERDSSSLLPRFVHVSWKRNGVNRGQILRKVGSGYSPVSVKEVLNA